MFLLRPDVKTPLDHPNERSLHTQPVPRVGGVAIMLGVTVSFVGLYFSHATQGTGTMAWLIALNCALFVISFFDDLYHLPVTIRFVAHLTVASFIVILIKDELHLWQLIVLALAIVWATNLFNFMDGADGLAGGMAIFGFGTYSVAAWDAGNVFLALISASIVIPTVVFLRFNLHPAKVFMGDAGSIPLGFLAAVLGIWGWRSNVWSWWLPLLVFSPFIVDASITLVRRVLRGEKIWQAHREHFYQRLVQLGWGHARTARAEYFLMAACASAALIFRTASTTAIALMLGLFALIYTALMLLIQRTWNKRTTPHEQT